MVDYEEYLHFSLEEIMEDPFLLSWIKGHRKDRKLDSMLKSAPEFAALISSARSICRVAEGDQPATDRAVIREMWHSIELFEEKTHLRKKNYSFLSILKYAAVFLMVASIAGLVYYRQNEVVVNESQLFAGPVPTEQSKLILSTGEVIDLVKQESSVTVDSKRNAIRINNDSVVKLSPAKTESAASMNKVVVPFGKKSIIELADGTRVWLNAGSKFAFPSAFDAKSREVFLDGEAFFDVAKNPEKPFFVKTHDISVRVLGTKFDISAYSSDLNVVTVLLEGSISQHKNEKMRLMGDETLLKPNQKAVYDKFKQTTQVTEERHTEYFTDWRDGWLTCKKVNLTDVFSRLERYYNVRITYTSPTPSNDVISGKLDLKESIDQVMNVLKDVAGIRYRIDNNNILIEKNEKMPMRNLIY
ncbi:MAG: FecR domain-containing protein [Marinilabiliales bacterium]|nr:FecR domain-containing protein [Marinilabiliales bacterium]